MPLSRYGEFLAFAVVPIRRRYPALDGDQSSMRDEKRSMSGTYARGGG